MISRVLFVIFCLPALAAADTGKEIYQKSCEQCHSIHAYNLDAPLVGDTARWDALLAEKGMELLVTHSIAGYEKMVPGQQFCPECTREDFERTIRYMAEQTEY